ncbi:MAG: hypothetical protein U0525_04635 [Patescibacteria group bacterium]
MKLLDNISTKMTYLVGTPVSILVHTIVFCFMFLLVFLDFWKLNDMLLFLTTILSIEAIYLAIFIQIIVNKTSKDVEEVGKDIDIIQKDDVEDDVYDEQVSKTLNTIEKRINKLQDDLEFLKRKGVMR